MDYSEDFRVVQTTLNYCNEFVKNFDKIIFYGGGNCIIYTFLLLFLYLIVLFNHVLFR